MTEQPVLITDLEPGSGASSLPALPATVEVRRRAGLAALVGVAASGVALAWFARAAQSMAVTDWLVAAVTGLVGLAHLVALVDARTPLAVVDAHGLRLRRGRTWRGTAWVEVAEVVHHPRRPWRDGRLEVALHSGEPLVVPLTLSTRLTGVGPDGLTATLAGLAVGRCPVVDATEGGPDAAAEPTPEPVPESVPEPALTEPERSGRSGRTERTERTRPASGPVPASPTPLPLRDPAPVSRADVVLGAAALRLDHDRQEHTVRLPEEEHLRRPDHDLVDDTAVRPLARPGEPVEPLVVDAPEAQPAAEPVVGPELAAARTRLGLSVDQLSERTRIRPHVIESIEVDDFVPCGGDFYARGHLRTLARVLGVDAAPLLATYDEDYADAPVDPRRVFEAELATGAGRPIRGTRGGPNWSVLVAAVMTVVLVWSIARLVTDGSVSLTPPVPHLNGSGGPNRAGGGAAADVPVTLTAAGGGARVVVRDGAGKVAYDGTLAFGQSLDLSVAAPVRVQTSDGSLEVSVDGQDRGAVGATGQSAQDTYVAR